MLSIFNPQFLPTFSLQTGSHTIPTTNTPENQPPPRAPLEKPNKKNAPGKPTEHHHPHIAEESFRSVHFRSSTAIAQQKSRPSTYGGQRMELTGWTVNGRLRVRMCIYI